MSNEQSPVSASRFQAAIAVLQALPATLTAEELRLKRRALDVVRQGLDHGTFKDCWPVPIQDPSAAEVDV